jgi:hypothetical protein
VFEDAQVAALKKQLAALTGSNDAADGTQTPSNLTVKREPPSPPAGTSPKKSRNDDGGDPDTPPPEPEKPKKKVVKSEVSCNVWGSGRGFNA